IGANGQVGMEVCLFLSQMDNVRVVPICRTMLGSSFLRKCGLECRIGTLDNQEEADRLLADCDLVADFSLPQGRPADVRAAMRRVVTNAITYAVPRARFVYISSLMALGVGSQSRSFRWHVLSKTVYGASKRYAE